jgi:hypothetical protein
MPVTKIANNVPLGIDSAGSLRSPLKLAPATIPLTAGKNIAKMLEY